MTEQIGNRIDYRRAWIISAIAAVHLLLSVVMFFLWGAVTMSRLDGEGPSYLTAILMNIAFGIASFPLVTVFLALKIANTGAWGWLAFLGNSLLWGWAGWRAIRFWRSRHAARQRIPELPPVDP